MIRSTHAIVDSPFTKGNYVNGLPDFVGQQYSLAFVASAAERLQDYDVNTLYFRDALFNRVPATFSRTSSATRVNKQGLIETVATGIPRIDYTDGSAKLLMEPSRTNLAIYSEDFTQGAWQKTSGASITANTGIAPDGTQTADTFTAGQNGSQVQLARAGTSGQAYTASFYIRRITGTGTVNIRAVENVNTPITITSSWQRYSLTVTSTTTTIRIGLRLDTIGDEIEIWGAQLEAGSYPTSYIPTAGSAVTRNRDTLVNIGKNTMLSDHTFYWQADSKVTPPVIQSIFNDLNNSQFIMQPSTSNALIINTTATGYNQTGFTFYNKLADGITLIEKRAGNDVTVYEDGYFATQTVSGDFNRLDFIANLYSNLGAFNNTWQVQKIIFFPTALTDSECIQLTS